MTMEGHMMRMRPAAGIDVPAGATVPCSSGGYHVMLVDLARPLAVGDRIPLTLTFEDRSRRRDGGRRSRGLPPGARALTRCRGSTHDGCQSRHGGAAPRVEQPCAHVVAGSTRAIVAWLSTCCVLVFAMIVVGGVTRLTHSGLSITEWQPIVGTLPPLDASAWNEAFAKYQATPEFREVNHAMTLVEFKRIFWWEYFHRLLGRAIGIAFLAPYLWFLARGRIPRRLVWPLAGIFVLGGLQGVVGWLMVQSGLVDDPRVSQFRLTAHLGLAFAILAVMLWIALSLAFPGRLGRLATPGIRRVRRFALQSSPRSSSWCSLAASSPNSPRASRTTRFR